MYHALIRTHHITSRKKVATLKAAAKNHGCYALLRSGGTPGIMYVRGEEGGVKEWVETVHVGPFVSLLLTASFKKLVMRYFRLLWSWSQASGSIRGPLRLGFTRASFCFSSNHLTSCNFAKSDKCMAH